MSLSDTISTGFCPYYTRSFYRGYEQEILCQVAELLEHGEDPNQIEPLSGKRCLSCVVPSIDLINVLLDAGANPNAEDEHGLTSLSYACKFPKSFVRLIERGANLWQSSSTSHWNPYLALYAHMWKPTITRVFNMNVVREIKYLVHITRLSSLKQILHQGQIRKRSEIDTLIDDEEEQVSENKVYMDAIGTKQDLIHLFYYGLEPRLNNCVLVFDPVLLDERNDYFFNFGWNMGRWSDTSYEKSQKQEWLCKIQEDFPGLITGNEILFENHVSLERLSYIILFEGQTSISKDFEHKTITLPGRFGFEELNRID